MVQRLMHGNGAKRASADSQHHKRFKFIADSGGNFFNMLHNLALVVRQLHPAKPAGSAVFFHGVLRGNSRLLHGFHFAKVDTVLKAYDIAHHMIHIQRNRFADHFLHWSTPSLYWTSRPLYHSLRALQTISA